MNKYNIASVSPDFVRDALQNRFEMVKDRRGGEIYEKFIDQLIEMIIDCWTNNTAWEIIDNRLINAEHYTYEEIYKRYIYDEDDEHLYKKREDLDEEEKELAIHYIHKRAEDHWHRYDDDIKETVAYRF